MSLSAADIAHATDLFSDLPDLTTRRMFGGLGIYCGGQIFAIMRSDGVILLKASPGPFADELADLGARPWTHTRKDGAQSTMPYFEVPEEIVEDRQQLIALSQSALAALR